MYINPDTDKIVVSNQNMLDMIRVLCRKALGKPVDELVVADIVSLVNHCTKIDPSVFKRKKEDSTTKDAKDAKKEKLATEGTERESDKDTE